MSQSYSGKQSTFSPSSYRDKTKPWYGTARWKNRRAIQLGLEPLCSMCRQEGRITPATIADHKAPHKGDEHLFWHGELQSLCKYCHDSHKQAQENGKARPATGVDGWPLT